MVRRCAGRFSKGLAPTIALKASGILARVGESAHGARALGKTLTPITSGATGGPPDLRGGRAEPGARVDRLAALADLEIQLRTAAATAVAGGGDGFARGDRLAGCLVEPFVVAGEAHGFLPLVPHGEQPPAG